ncbi:MAG: AraC family transcriptional regulator [Bacteroidales bacterium]|nr:AraC family transcriptional regulator [Bacteroidales bacterium]MCF8386743.1 AraC family transcriptional regulator [Bacteroidales bacterium]MCF8397265.1 AraC family transcriptional regulator [Bacteroidales bacterium]
MIRPYPSASRTFVFIILMMFSSNFNHGKSANSKTYSGSLDSLELFVDKVSKKLRPDLLIKISQSLEGENLVEAYECSKSALNIAIQLDNINNILKCNLQIARIKILQDSLKSARDVLKDIISYPEEAPGNDSLSEDFKIVKAKAEFLNTLLCFYNSPDSVKNAILNVQNALFYLKSNNEKLYLAHSYLMLGNLYFYLGLYHQGLAFYKKSLSIIKLHNFGPNQNLFFFKLFSLLDETGKQNFTNVNCNVNHSFTKANLLTALYIKLGYANNRIKSFSSAKANFDKALEIAKLTYNTEAQVCILSRLGSLYLEMKNFEKAKDYLEHALQISRNRHLQNFICSNAIQLSKLYRLKKDYQRAHQYLKTAGSSASASIPFNLQVGFALEKGKLFFEQGEYERAVKYFKQYYDSCLAINDVPYLHKLSHHIYKAQDSLGNYQDAIRFYKQYRIFNDSLRTMDDKILLNVTKLNLDIDKVESEMDILEKNKILKNIEMRRKQVIVVSSASGFIILLIFTLSIFVVHNRKKHAYSRLMEKNLALVKEHSKKTTRKNKTRESHGPDRQKINNLVVRLNKLIDDQKIFLDPNISLKKLAKKLNTNSSYLSHVINQTYHTNFTAFINEHRILEAQKLMTEKSGQYLSIEGIAMQVGFRSKSVFNPAFKKYTGVTPSFYMNYIRANKNKK